MSDKDHKLDDLYKNKFSNFELPVSEGLLNKIKQDAGIEKTVSKQNYWKWILSAILLLAGISSYIFFPTPSPSPKGTQEAITKINNITTTETITNATNNDGLTTTKAIESQTANELTRKTKTENTSIKTSNLKEANSSMLAKAEGMNRASGKGLTEEKISTSSEWKTKTQKEKNTTSESVEGTTKAVSDAKKSKTKIKNETTGVATKKAKEGNFNKQILEVKDAKTFANKDVNITSTEPTVKEKLRVDVSKQIVNIIDKKETEIETNTSDVPIENKGDTSKQIKKDSALLTKEVGKTSTIKDSRDSSVVKMDSVLAIAKKTKTDSVPPATKPPISDDSKNISDKKICFFVSIVGAPTYSYRLLTASNDLALSHRNENEKSMYSYSMGIDFGTSIKDKLMISVGVSLDNKGESYSYAGMKAKYDTTIVIDSVQGQIITHIVLNEKQARIDAFTTKNMYQFLSIPISIAYQFNINEKWFVMPNVGVAFNYLLSAKSEWFDEQQNKVVNYSKADGIYSNYAFAAQVGLAVGMNVTKKLSIRLQPNYNRFLQSVYKSSTNLNLLPYSYDLNIGVRYKF